MQSSCCQGTCMTQAGGALLEDFGSVVLPIAQDGHAELSAMPSLPIVLHGLSMHIRLIPAGVDVWTSHTWVYHCCSQA